MTTLREAAQQALEALEGEFPGWRTPAQENAITSLRAALAQPEQEPVAWIESPHGVIRRNPLHRITAPQSLAWSIPLYAHPPRREWQGLTEEEIQSHTHQIMDEEPKALVLADVLQEHAVWEGHYGASYLGDLLPQAAAELRRLHELNTDKTQIIAALCGNITELLEALKVLLNNNEALTGENIARAAIAKAEGK